MTKRIKYIMKSYPKNDTTVQPFETWRTFDAPSIAPTKDS